MDRINNKKTEEFPKNNSEKKEAEKKPEDLDVEKFSSEKSKENDEQQSGAPVGIVVSGKALEGKIVSGMPRKDPEDVFDMPVDQFHADKDTPEIVKNSIQEGVDRIKESSESFFDIYTEKISESYGRVKAIEDLVEKSKIRRGRASILKSTSEVKTLILRAKDTLERYQDNILAPTYNGQELRDKLLKSVGDTDKGLSALEELLDMYKLSSQGRQGREDSGGEKKANLDVRKEYQEKVERKENLIDKKTEKSQSEDENKDRNKGEKDREDGKVKGGEGEKTEEDKKREELKEEVERARSEYARKHYEVNNTFSKLRGILGKHLRTGPKEIGETDRAYDQYKKTLNGLKNYELSQINEDSSLTSEMKREKLGNLIKFFNLDEKMDLYDAHSQAKAEVFEEKFGKYPGWVAKKGSDFINWYRKQDWKWKMAGGVALTVTGLGALSVANRIVSGAATGTGIAAMMEARHRKKEQEKSEGKKERIFEGLGHIKDPEEKMKFINSHLEGEIGGLDKDLEKEKRQALYRKAAGVTAGILVGSGALSHAIRGTLDHIGVTGNLSELSHDSSSSHSVQEVAGQPDISHSAEVPAAPEIPDNIELDVSKGSSFEGELIKHLEGTGMDHKEAGKMAHRMYLEYAGSNPDPATHDYSLIQPGARIELSPDGQHITGFEESPGPNLGAPETADLPDNAPAAPEADIKAEGGVAQIEKWIEAQDSLTQEEIEASKKAALYEKSFFVFEHAIVALGATYGLYRLGKYLNKLRKKKIETSDAPEKEKHPEKNPETKRSEKKEPKTGKEKAPETHDKKKKEKHSKTDSLSFFTKRFDDLFKRQERIQEVKRKYPGLEKEDIPEEKKEELRKIYHEIRRSEKNIKLSRRAKKDVAEGIDEAGRAIEDLEKIIKKESEKLEKRRKSRDSIQKGIGNLGELFYLKEQSRMDLSEMLRFMLKLVGKKEGSLDLGGADLDKLLSENPKNGIGRIYQYYSRILGKDIVKPRPGEDMGLWSVRFLQEVFKSKRIIYNKTKSAQANKKNDRSK